MKSSHYHPPSFPALDDSVGIAEFAASFDGYKHFGSVEACCTGAKKRRRETLVDIRNELFFEARASYHRNDDEYLEVYRQLLPLFESFATEGDTN